MVLLLKSATSVPLAGPGFMLVSRRLQQAFFMKTELSIRSVWGFPTVTQDPYRTDGAKTATQTSHPFLLGKFALAETEK
jgi:hypothetical protein